MTTLRFDQQDWERVERDTMAWWAGDLERPLVWFTASDPLPNNGRYSFLSNYPLDRPIEEIADLYEPVFAATHFYGDAVPAWWPNFGPGMMAGFMGARVNSVSQPGETVWFSPTREVSIRDQDLAYSEENIWWKRVRDITTLMTQRWGDQIAVGHTDLGGNLDILASFRGTEGLLLELIDSPKDVERLVGRITALWKRYYDELDAIIRAKCRGTTCWAPVWSTGRTYMLQCDFSYMLSPTMFEQFVAPDLWACCEHLDHAFYHLDGKGQIPHLDALLAIPRLRGIQWIPGDGQPPAEEWLPLLKRIRDSGKLCQLFVSPAGARTVVQNLGGRGFLLAISHSDPDFADPEQAEAFLRTLAREDASLGA